MMFIKIVGEGENMKLTIAHKIIISICGVLAFAFLNSAFAIYS